MCQNQTDAVVSGSTKYWGGNAGLLRAQKRKWKSWAPLLLRCLAFLVSCVASVNLLGSPSLPLLLHHFVLLVLLALRVLLSMCVHLLPSLPLVFPCSSLLRAAWCCLSLSSTASLHPVLSLFCTALPCSCCCSRLAFRVPVAPGNSLALRCPPSVFSLANVAQAVARACFPKWPPCLSAFVLRFVGRLVRRGWGGGVILRVRFHTCPCLFTLLHLFMLSFSDFLSCP